MSVLKNILVPTDFSSNSSGAIRYACDLARQTKSTLHMLYVSKNSADSSSDRAKQLERIATLIDAQSELALDTLKSVKNGIPGTVIVDYARDNNIDMVVMGTHGRTGLAHLALGSVAENVMRDSPCPVTVIGPHDGENTTIQHGVSVIEAIVGDGLETGQEEGRGQMLKALVEQLRIPSTTAIIMLNELEHRQWLKWEQGSWNTIEGNEWVEVFEPVAFDTTSDTQAIDLIKRARLLRATDVHIDPYGPEENKIRLRIDGKLRDYCRMQRSVADHLVNQLSTLAGLDIADPFRAQEGRIRMPENMSGLEARLTSVPVLPNGKAAAIRLLDPEKVFRPLNELGLSDSAFETVKQILQQGEGLILVAGPTGSGKTTTVYSMLETIGGEHQNIVSIEDPVEFSAPFVRQISVDNRHDLTLHNGLRTLLRMDPDVLFIGEIRDPETAAIAMRAAGSGKYVFSTLHSRDVASTITMLHDLELEAYSVAANLSGILNQRLTRRLCDQCKQPYATSEDERAAYQQHGLEAPENLFKPVGCVSCGESGYFGRIGIFEVALINDEIRSSIRQSQPPEITGASLQMDALAKAANGLISFSDAEGIRWLS